MLRTVTGEVLEKVSGNILMHEHIRCASNDMIHTFKDKWLDNDVLIEHAANILSEVKRRYNIEVVVDGTPIDSGRDVKVLREVSKRSGVKIIASTGLYHFPSMITAFRCEEEIAQWFIEECENGAEGTDIKPGILKCACDNSGITAENEKSITAVAEAQIKTGLPIYVHCMHQDNTVDKALKIILDKGVNPDKIIVGHLGIRSDFEYIKKILESGCYISVDQCHCAADKAEQTAKTLVRLSQEGYSDRIVLSNDVCIYSDFESQKTAWLKEEIIPSTFGFIFERIYPKYIKYGGTDTAWSKMLSENPFKILR